MILEFNAVAKNPFQYHRLSKTQNFDSYQAITFPAVLQIFVSPIFFSRSRRSFSKFEIFFRYFITRRECIVSWLLTRCTANIFNWRKPFLLWVYTATHR